MWPVDPNIE
nr:Chain W, TAT PROTEIN [Human immunodeficiency virus 1]2BGN_X Chain X, TAT PROTEIN [Human immunodeficiency virus 1]2BGN_Y Chain Y, TAT PROTEIN [Human immunodeficiency virus 1]2BGN_Z Chain Z, TAT PROTEIN [Human immunodeficiency virus 1]